MTQWGERKRAGLRRITVPLVSTLAMLMPFVVASPAQASGGTVWTLQSAPNDTWGGVTYGDDTFVAVGSNAGGQILTSPDGITWTPRSAAAGAWRSVIYAGGRFVAVATFASNSVVVSTDGVTWTPQTRLNPLNWYSVAYGDDTYVLSGERAMAYSLDGLFWTDFYTDMSAHSWKSVTYGDDTFVTVNADAGGASNRVMTSRDGVTWTPRNAGIAANEWQSVAYGAGVFVAVASTGTDRVMTSEDGVAWTPRAAATQSSWRSVTYGAGQFIAVGDGGAVMTSPNGISWTSQTSGNTADWRAVTAGPLYVAVGSTSGQPVMTSFINPAPSVTTVNPSSGAPAGGYQATIDGTGFAAGMSVTIGGNSCTSVNVVSSTQLTCTVPPGTPGSALVTVTNPDSQSGSAAAAFHYLGSAPPAPVAASPPIDVIATGGDASASLTWSAPTSSGSYPVTYYQATSSLGGRTCLVAAPELSCEIGGLTNGTTYTFAVKALTGAGWSAASDPSNAVTPSTAPSPSIMITGARNGRLIAVSGTSTGLGMGAVLKPWVRLSREASPTEGIASILVSMNGTFEWSRRSIKAASIYVQTPDGSARSNTVTIPRPSG